MKMCWNLEPTERPNFSKIAEMVQKFIGEQPEQESVSACQVLPDLCVSEAPQPLELTVMLGFIRKRTIYMHLFSFVCSKSTRICNRKTPRLKCTRSLNAATAHVTRLVTMRKRSRP